MSGTGEDDATFRPSIMLEIEVDGHLDLLRTLVEEAADRLMETLIATSNIVDPFISLSVHPNDWDEPVVHHIGRPEGPA